MQVYPAPAYDPLWLKQAVYTSICRPYNFPTLLFVAIAQCQVHRWQVWCTPRSTDVTGAGAAWYSPFGKDVGRMRMISSPLAIGCVEGGLMRHTPLRQHYSQCQSCCCSGRTLVTMLGNLTHWVLAQVLTSVFTDQGVHVQSCMPQSSGQGSSSAGNAATHSRQVTGAMLAQWQQVISTQGSDVLLPCLLAWTRPNGVASGR